MNWEEARFPLTDAGRHPFQAAGLGLNAVDQVLRVDHYPALGEKIHIADTSIQTGGQVATALCACRAFGLERVRYAGTVGDDERGRIQRESLAASGVDTALLLTRSGSRSQWASIVVDGRSGERTILWERSPALDFRPGELDPADLCQAPVLLLDGYDGDACLACAREARRRGILTVMDIDCVRPSTRELLSLIDFCVASQEFPRLFTGVADPDGALLALADQTGHFVAATRGRQGVAFVWDGRVERLPVRPVNTVDSTGAGDVFHGGFVYGLAREWPLGRILRFANAAAALNCTALGARGGLRSEAEVMEFMVKG